MRRLLARCPSPAMVVACVALVVALGGTGYAAINLPRNSVGTKQLRPNAVTSGKVRNGSLTAKDFKASTLPRGPRGAQGPKGDSAPGAIPRVGYASRDLFGAGLAGPAIALSAAYGDHVGLDVPAGTAGYTSSSGVVTANGQSRLIADGQAVITNSGVPANVNCRIVLVGADARVIGYVNSQIPQGGYIPVAVSGGADIEARSYNVRLQCSAEAAGLQFHRGNLTVAIAPR